MKYALTFLAGSATATLGIVLILPHPTYTETPQGWKLEHLPLPPCRNTRTITLDRDEDALRVSCEVR